MKIHLTLFLIFICLIGYSQSETSSPSDTLKAGVIFEFDMRKHACGQKYYIKIMNDTIMARLPKDLNIDNRKLPIDVYLSVSDQKQDQCGLSKINYITRKE